MRLNEVVEPVVNYEVDTALKFYSKVDPRYRELIQNYEICNNDINLEGEYDYYAFYNGRNDYDIICEWLAILDNYWDIQKITNEYGFNTFVLYEYVLL